MNFIQLDLANALNNYIFISSPELTALRFDIQNNTSSFRTAMEEWAIQCSKGKNGINCFKEKVFPTLLETQKVIEDNPILKHLRSIEAGKMVINLYIGEVSPIMLWKFYARNQMITPEELTHLSDKYALQSPYTIPIVFFLPENFKLNRLDFGKMKEELEPPVSINVTSTRKFIDID